jgi:hypothetical protein
VDLSSKFLSKQLIHSPMPLNVRLPLEHIGHTQHSEAASTPTADVFYSKDFASKCSSESVLYNGRAYHYYRGCLGVPILMGFVFSRIFSSLFGSKETRMLILGLDNAGKTTLLYKLQLGTVTETIPSES